MKKLIKVIVITAVILCYNENYAKGKWWSLYFTSPGKRSAALKFNNPERAFIRAIKKARKNLSGAFYDLSSPEIVKVLINAKDRGLDIRLVTERDNFDDPEILKLLKSGIKVVTDNKNGLMHNKFAVIDNNIIWTGSYNLTVNGSGKNNNNAIMIYSKELAKIYLNEFNEMFKNRVFGNRKESGPFARFRKKYYVELTGPGSTTDINVYFAPEDNVERIILKRIKKAKKSIHFMAFSFTSDRIGEMMIKKHKSGVKVFGLFEGRGSGSRYSEYIKMKIEGLPVKVDRNRYAMHHKVIIIDGESVITGSYNFSKNANKKNDENIIIIMNKEISGEFLKEFYRLYR